MNYYDTFIEVADDCPVLVAGNPQSKGDTKAVALDQYEMILNHSRTCTQEDVLFEAFAARRRTPEEDKATVRSAFFSKGSPAFAHQPWRNGATGESTRTRTARSRSTPSSQTTMRPSGETLE